MVEWSSVEDLCAGMAESETAPLRKELARREGGGEVSVHSARV